ncbi:MAG: FadR family transcriptional regulator [Xanthomonadaceae bacterium]|nr:FadR family transcriptional regulator [Xanthomonadaceae bacterium]
MEIEVGTSPKLYQRVANSIVAEIRSGKYPRGERLPPERELAEEFGVSRPTVREAMIALEIRGIVEARRGSGIYVVEAAPPETNATEQDIGPFEVTEARRLFEGESAALAAAIITDEEIAKLEELLAILEANATSEVGERADRDFHIAIAEATRNSAIASVIETLWDMRYKSPMCMKMFDRARDAGVQPRFDDHSRILQALKARDPQAARAAMRSHLDRVINSMLSATETDALERARSEFAAKREELAKRRSI